MLVWITLTHLPTGLSRYVNQPFGYLSATEGFIFLAALFTGLIYFRLAEREGYRAMCNKLWMRTRRLYWYQALLLAFAFVVEAQIAAHGNRPAVHNLLSFYFAAGPKRAIVDGALLIYRPPLLDILPMYILFLALTPLALIAAARLGWRYILGGGLTLWLLAQFGQRQFAYHLMTRAFGLQIPLNEMGAFDLWAWQFWWVVGLWLGVRWAKGKDSPFEAWAARITPLAAVATIFFLALRYLELFGVVGFGNFAFLVDKWHLGVFRMIDFAAVATLAVRFRSVLQGIAIRPLVMLGQASLQVFCVHLMFVFLGLTLLGDAAVLSGWRVPVLMATSLSTLLVTARIFAKDSAKTGRNGRAQFDVPGQRGAGYRTLDQLKPVSQKTA